MTTPSPTQPQDSSNQMFMLGQIHALVQSLKDGQESQARELKEGLAGIGTRVDKIDERLRTVEQRSAVVGAVSGGAMGIGISLIAEGLRQWINGGGPAR